MKIGLPDIGLFIATIMALIMMPGSIRKNGVFVCQYKIMGTVDARGLVHREQRFEDSEGGVGYDYIVEYVVRKDTFCLKESISPGPLPDAEVGAYTTVRYMKAEPGLATLQGDAGFNEHLVYALFEITILALLFYGTIRYVLSWFGGERPRFESVEDDDPSGFFILGEHWSGSVKMMVKWTLIGGLLIFGLIQFLTAEDATPDEFMITTATIDSYTKSKWGHSIVRYSYQVRGTVHHGETYEVKWGDSSEEPEHVGERYRLVYKLPDGVEHKILLDRKE